MQSVNQKLTPSTAKNQSNQGPEQNQLIHQLIKTKKNSSKKLHNTQPNTLTKQKKQSLNTDKMRSMKIRAAASKIHQEMDKLRQFRNDILEEIELMIDNFSFILQLVPENIQSYAKKVFTQRKEQAGILQTQNMKTTEEMQKQIGELEKIISEKEIRISKLEQSLQEQQANEQKHFLLMEKLLKENQELIFYKKNYQSTHTETTVETNYRNLQNSSAFSLSILKGHGSEKGEIWTRLKIKKNNTMDNSYAISKKGMQSISSLDSLQNRLKNLKSQLDKSKRDLLNY